MTLVCPLWGSGAQTSAGHVPTEVMLPAMPAPTARLLHTYARKRRLPTIRMLTHALPWSRIRPLYLVLNQCATLFIYACLTTLVSFNLFSPKRPDWVWSPPSLLCSAHLGLLRRRYSGRSVKLTTHSHLMPRL